MIAVHVCVCLYAGTVSIYCLINEMTMQSRNRRPPPVSTRHVFITANSKLRYNNIFFFTSLQSHLYLSMKIGYTDKNSFCLSPLDLHRKES